MITVGVTGTFGAGKTTVCRTLDLCGIPGVSCDDIARRIRRSPEIAAKIAALFGSRVLGPDGIPDAARVAAIAFRNDPLRRRLEALMHPPIFHLLDRFLLDFRSKGCTIVYAEVPLLFETHSEWRFNRILVVYTKFGTVRSRLAPLFPAPDVALRMKAQMLSDDKIKRADYLIDNSGTMHETQRNVRALAGRMRNEIFTGAV